MEVEMHASKQRGGRERDNPPTEKLEEGAEFSLLGKKNTDG